VQILGAEKALFRALKTKHDTPKYGLIYHASLIGQTAPKFKGKIARVLAAKTALAIRVDALGDKTEASIGYENRAKVESLKRQLEDEEGEWREVREGEWEREKSKDDEEKPKKKKKKKKSKDDEEKPKKKKKLKSKDSDEDEDEDEDMDEEEEEEEEKEEEDRLHLRPSVPSSPWSSLHSPRVPPSAPIVAPPLTQEESFYSGLLAMALDDGVLATSEEAKLATARAKYGISEEQHARLLKEAQSAQMNC
jgi:nucleolar protein 58